MKYYVWYETETHRIGKYIPYGELTTFKKTCKKNGWEILNIEKFDKNGKVIR